MAFERIVANRWVPDEELAYHLQDESRCSVDFLTSALSHLSGVTVESVAIRRDSYLDVPADPVFGMPPHRVEDLPHFCDVVLHQHGDGGQVAEVRVWVPLAWNGRFMGTGGGGNRLTVGVLGFPSFRSSTIATAMRNGFATASTDGGYGADPRFCDWQLDPTTRELDAELIENWAHRSTHQMTLIGKAVTAALYGQEPRFSYFQGCSGGGRQALAEAMYHPQDYDGIWSDAPAINWTRFIPSMGWAAVVMNELGSLAPSKLEAFRRAAIADFNEQEGGSRTYITHEEAHEFEASRVVGTMTESGVITSRDAKVMQLIWEGPHSPSGERLWYGLRPGAESWGHNGAGMGACLTAYDEEGRLRPIISPVALSWFQTWILQDPEWDWTVLDRADFARLFEIGKEKFGHISMDNPDLQPFSTEGGKILFTQGLDDELVFPEGIQHYYNRVTASNGGREETRQFARLFLFPGDGHGAAAYHGVGPDLATGMAALMNWVEHAIGPESLVARRFAGNGELMETFTVREYDPTGRKVPGHVQVDIASQ
ncbi:tannase/feruloyl esterase family alpha/beta hydrolase [Paenarthrobacter sp. NPDC057981]|uniref:tannase/feruloyl esterase family alpha/beta hydrolase n=1 Tax=Paenarthrobacter sp. NPDC057981 TaxID=3346297 RepID=UPI0036D941AA